MTFLLIEVGLIGGWTSPYLAKLTAGNSSLPLTPDEASWVASLMNFSRLFGGIAGAAGCQMVGSKMTTLLCVLPTAICWIFMIAAGSAEWLYVARLSGGASMGMAFACFPLYLGEISDPKTRGGLITMAMIGPPTGNALVSLIGSIFNVVQSSVAFLVGCVFLLVFFAWLPESPHHLAGKSDPRRARESIAWYQRGCDVDAEYAALEKFVAAANASTFRESLAEFRRPEIQRATFVVLALFAFMQMSGLNNIIFYMATILTHARVTMVDPSMCATIVMSFGIAAAVVSVNLMDRLGRRALLICSSVMFSISLTVLEVHFGLIESGFRPVQWLPIAALVFTEIAIFLGLSPVPSTVLSELFPPSVKCIASCAASVTSAITAFVCTKTYQPLIDLMGERHVYWIYVAVVLLAIPFAIFVMPETKGKSLQQIQADIMSGKSVDASADSR